MRILVPAFLLGLTASASVAQAPPQADDEVVFTVAGTLLAWCEEEARARYAGRGLATHQFTGRHYESGNTLHAEGTLRVDGDDVAVACRAARGARERYGVISVEDGSDA